jgi:CheY-like chemotaxis protein
MSEAAENRSVDPARPPVVLVVEDEVLLRSSIAEHLRLAGYTVIEATSGTEAIGVLTAGNNVDAVFSDVQMPGSVDGFGLARWMSVNCSGIPLVLTSGNRDIRETAEAARFFAKPYHYKDVAQCIAALLGAG